MSYYLSGITSNNCRKITSWNFRIYIIKGKCVTGKLGEMWTDFEVKYGKSASIMGIDDLFPGKSALHLASSIDTL